MQGTTKILHAITRLDKGGSSENTLLSAMGLVRKGYDVDVLFGYTEDANEQLMLKAKRTGVHFVQEPSLVRDIHLVKDSIAFFNVLNIISRGRYDLVHAHSHKAGFICRIAAKFAGVKKVVYTPHGHVFYGYFGSLLTKMIIFAERFAAHFTDMIIGLTDAECEEWLDLKIGRKEQYVSIVSGVDFD